MSTSPQPIRTALDLCDPFDVLPECEPVWSSPDPDLHRYRAEWVPDDIHSFEARQIDRKGRVR